MNKTFKIVFNKARGALMVANEITGSVQKKGTKLIVAAGVLGLTTVGSAAAAALPTYTQNSGQGGYLSAQNGESKVFEEESPLVMEITGSETQAYGLLATGKKSTYTNKGTIKTNIASGNDAAKYWKVKGMMADAGGTAVNEGTIEVTNAYGMTVGSTKGDGEYNTLINKGTITVSDNGYAIEAGPTGTAGNPQGDAHAKVTNEGTITGNGILVAGNGGEIVNQGTIDATDKNAFYVHRETNYSTEGNSITLAKGSTTKGSILIQGNNNKDSGVVKDTTLTIEDGAQFDGRIVVKYAKGTQVEAEALNLSGQNIAILFQDSGDNSSLVIKNSNFSKNVAGNLWGGAIQTYAQKFEVSDSTFTENESRSPGLKQAIVPADASTQDGAMGGAMFIKGSPVTLTNVVFTGNKAIATKDETKTETTYGGVALGGAILADLSTGTGTGDGVKRNANITFKVTKDLTYAGNTVETVLGADRQNEDAYINTYSGFAPYAQAGGFLYLDRGAAVSFDVAADKTLTIGEEGVTGDTDGIASSVPGDGINHANIDKNGAGSLVVNGSLEKYYGTLNVKEGSMTVNSSWNIKNAVTVDKGATLALSEFTLMDEATSGNFQHYYLSGGKADVDKNNANRLGGTLAVSGTLKTSSDQVFTAGLGDGSIQNAQGKKYADRLTFAGGSTLMLTDNKFNFSYSKTVTGLLSDIDINVVFLGDLAESSDGTIKVDDILTTGTNNSVYAGVKLDATSSSQTPTNLVIGREPTGDDNAKLVKENVGVQALLMDQGAALTIKDGKTLTLVGDGSTELVNGARSVLVNGATLTLGIEGDSAQGGTLSPEVTLGANGKLEVRGGSSYNLTKLVAESGSHMMIGSRQTAGVLHVDSLDLKEGASIFLDPAWQDGATIADASFMSAASLTGNTIAGDIAVGQNSVVALNAPKASAISAFNKTGLTWGADNVTAALFIGAPTTVFGSINVNGVMTADTGAIYGTPGRVSIQNHGLLMVDQTGVGSSAAINGSLTLASGSYVGIANADAGSVILATEVADDGATVVTDNPFLEGAINGNSVDVSVSPTGGLGALASTGIQAMTRRADTVLAQTIADRTSVDQELAAGTNLWVDVTGERYEADKLDNGGEFKSDMGYGAFGADFAVTQDITAGAAFQYGKGTLRSGVSSIKNSIDSYGVTAYGAMKFGEAKVVAEASYVKNENDITSSQTALNQSVDSEIYSVGVRGQHRFTAGNFQFVPSVGVRVSRLNTDAMQVGAVNIKKQEQTLVQVPIALRVNGFEQNVSGWSVAPSFKVAYVPTFGDKEISVFGADQTVIDTSPVQGDFGIRAQNGNLMVNANMMLGGGKDGTSSVGGKVGLKYIF